MKKGTCLLIALLITGLLLGCSPKEFFPDSGEWYCKELEMQLTFGSSGDCYVMRNGEKIKCACGTDKGSSYLSVCCQEPNCNYCYLGEEIFGASFVSLNEDVLVVKSNDGIEYLFLQLD